MNYTKKFIIATATVLAVCGAYAAGSSGLTTQVGDLQMKLQRMNKIQALTNSDKENQQEITELSKKLKALQYDYNNVVEKDKTNTIIINSLRHNNKTLREQKESLESNALLNQKQFAKNYNDQVNSIQSDNAQKMKETLEKHSLTAKLYEKELAQLKEGLSTKIIKLQEFLGATQKQLSDSQQDNTLNDKTILSLQHTITSLSDSKKALEEKLFNAQKETNAAFKKQISEISAKAQQNVDEMKAHYNKLCAENNTVTQSAAADYTAKTATEKKVLAEKAQMLIKRVNAYKSNLDRVAGDIAQSSDSIGKSTAALREAYKKIPNPNKGKSSWYTSLMQQVGVYDKKPAWDTIQKQTTMIGDNVATIRGIAHDLDKANLNTKTVMDENKVSGGCFDWF